MRAKLSKAQLSDIMHVSVKRAQSKFVCSAEREKRRAQPNVSVKRGQIELVRSAEREKRRAEPNDARFKTFSVLKNKSPLLKRAVSASLFREEASMRLEALVYKALSEGLVSKERAAVLLNQQVADVEFNTESV